MVVKQPRILIKTEYRYMSMNYPITLIDEMPCYTRIFYVQLLIRLFKPFLISMHKGIFPWIYKTRLKKELPQGIQIHPAAGVGFFVRYMMQNARKISLVMDVHIQKSDTTLYRHSAVFISGCIPVNNLRLALDLKTICKFYKKFRHDY